MNTLKNRLRVLLVCSVFASVAAQQAMAQTCNQSLTFDNCSTSPLPPTPLTGDSGNYGYVWTYTTYSLQSTTSPGCCGNITYPSCTQPVAPITVTATYTLTTTINQTQSFNASLGLDSLFNYLKGPSWLITKGTSYTSTTSNTSSVVQTIFCGSKLQVYLGTTTTLGHETRTDANSKQFTRDENNTSMQLVISPTMGTNDTYNPCTGKVVTGAKCPPVYVSILCASTNGGISQ